VPAEGVGRGWMGVAVTEQRDEEQEGSGGRRGWGRESKRLRQSTRVTAADAFPNAKRRRDAEVTNRSVSRQDHVAETEKVLRNGLGELSADHERRERNADSAKRKRGAKEVRGNRGRTELHERSQR